MIIFPLCQSILPSPPLNSVLFKWSVHSSSIQIECSLQFDSSGVFTQKDVPEFFAQFCKSTRLLESIFDTSGRDFEINTPQNSVCDTHVWVSSQMSPNANTRSHHCENHREPIPTAQSTGIIEFIHQFTANQKLKIAFNQSDYGSLGDPRELINVTQMLRAEQMSIQ